MENKNGVIGFGMKAKEMKRWSSDDVRYCCIKNNYYTRGTTEQYDRMLKQVDWCDPDLTNIFVIAKDIFDHTDWGDDFEREYGTETFAIETIMYALDRDAVHTTYEVEYCDEHLLYKAL